MEPTLADNDPSCPSAFEADIEISGADLLSFEKVTRDWRGTGRHGTGKGTQFFSGTQAVRKRLQIRPFNPNHPN
jgi:hypothetical protein